MKPQQGDERPQRWPEVGDVLERRLEERTKLVLRTSSVLGGRELDEELERYVDLLGVVIRTAAVLRFRPDCVPLRKTERRRGRDGKWTRVLLTYEQTFASFDDRTRFRCLRLARDWFADVAPCGNEEWADFSPPGKDWDKPRREYGTGGAEEENPITQGSGTSDEAPVPTKRKGRRRMRIRYVTNLRRAELLALGKLLGKDEGKGATDDEVRRWVGQVVEKARGELLAAPKVEKKKRGRGRPRKDAEASDGAG